MTKLLSFPFLESICTVVVIVRKHVDSSQIKKERERATPEGGNVFCSHHPAKRSAALFISAINS